MDWRDEGIVIGLSKHGESAVVLEVFTRGHGRHKGYVHGGVSRRKRGILQVGNVAALAWRARVADSLGTFTVEPVAAHAAAIMIHPGPLAGLRSLALMLSRALPERDPHPTLYDRFLDLLAELSTRAEDDPEWGAALARFERDLLAEVGYGLDLSVCAVTGAREGLAFVSPKTGRAVTVAGAGEYRDRLLSLPEFLLQPAPAEWPAVEAGLHLTAHFLERFFSDSDRHGLPEDRRRLMDLVRKKAARYGGVRLR